MPWMAGIVLGLVGIICGYLGGRYIGESSMSGAALLLNMALLLLCFYGVSYIQIIAHEMGHLIAAKISGYDFVSFRIGKLMLIKKGKQYVLKKYMIAGTGGQCLMMPPMDNPYDYPCTLYNLGGVLANGLISGICLIVYLVLPLGRWMTIIVLMLCIVGLFFMVMNGIPMKISGISNDGDNTLYLRKSKNTRYALWVQLYINALMTSGKRIEDIPSQYFELPEDADLKDPIICTIGVYKCNYLHSQRAFEKAKKLIYDLLKNAPGLLEIHKNELRCELLFYEIIGKCRKEEIDKLHTKELKKYIQLTSSYPSRRRLMYAYELLVNHDERAAEKEYHDFEKLADQHPYEGEIEDERELLELIDSIR